MEEKRQQKKDSSTKTHSSAAAGKTNTSTLTFPTSTPVIEEETATKIMACMMRAHLINSINPGSYSDDLNRALKLNNLPPVILPDNPPSKQTLNLTNEKQTAVPQENTQTNVNTHSQEAPNTAQHTQVDQNTTQQGTEMPPLKKIPGHAIGLQIITRKSEGWPKGTTLSLRSIKTGIYTGMYKWRYTYAAYNEQEILLYLQNNDIDLTNGWCTAEDTQLNKIHNGLHQDLTPPHYKVTKHKHGHRHFSK